MHRFALPFFAIALLGQPVTGAPLRPNEVYGMAARCMTIQQMFASGLGELDSSKSEELNRKALHWAEHALELNGNNIEQLKADSDEIRRLWLGAVEGADERKKIKFLERTLMSCARSEIAHFSER